MTKVLVVEDHPQWKRRLKDGLAEVVGRRNVHTADNYETAVSMLGLDYSAYVLDGNFPKRKNGNPEPLGIEFAQAIHQRGVSYDKITMISGDSDTLQQARELGITRVYNKLSPNRGKGERDIGTLVDDLRPLLTR